MRVDALGQVVVGDRGRKLVQLDGKVGELHLAGQHVMQRAAAAFRAIDRGRVPRDKGRAEERKALDVIPVRMSEENVRVNGPPCPGPSTAAASRCAPVPQSKIRRSPLAVVSSTQEVLPPKWFVPGPGVAIDPRVPQKRTLMRTRPPSSAESTDRHEIAPVPWRSPTFRPSLTARGCSERPDILCSGHRIRNDAHPARPEDERAIRHPERHAAINTRCEGCRNGDRRWFRSSVARS